MRAFGALPRFLGGNKREQGQAQVWLQAMLMPGLMSLCLLPRHGGQDIVVLWQLIYLKSKPQTQSLNNVKASG